MEENEIHFPEKRRRFISSKKIRAVYGKGAVAESTVR